jgi:acetyl-CoA carboxylase biotin carboxyl carrier protein
MDIKEIKQIVEIMKRSDLTDFEIEEKDLKLRISRSSKNEGVHMSTLPVIPQAAPLPTPPAEQTPPPAAGAATPAEDANVDIIKSPMVGTFYRSPSPESPAFVDLNTQVQPDTVVCIVEAMKVMNEIQAEIQGTIIEVLAENGQAIEFGQPLFKVRV